MARSTRRGLAAAVAGLLVASAAAETPRAGQNRTFDLLTAGIGDIQQAVAGGALTYERLVQLYLNRIDAFDARGPRLNAVLAVNARALDIARDLDEERTRQGLRGPLHGIPFAIKDNVDTADLPTTAGSRALAGLPPPPRDATIIQRLKTAGAVVLVKTNLDEFARGTQGLSSLGGQTLNPYDLARNPGGSSSGTAVAVAAGFAAVGIATETGVSIRSPASNTALVGLAPTRGLVSRAGVVPVSFTQDRVGVHAKSAADAGLVLDHLRGLDADDLSTAASLGRTEAVSYAEGLEDVRLADVRVGVLADLFREGAQFTAVNDRIHAAIAALAARGAHVIDGLTTGRDLVGLFPRLRVNDFEFRSALDAYLARRSPRGPIGSVPELVATGGLLSRLDRVFQNALARGPLDLDTEYQARLIEQQQLRDQLVALMDRHQLDALAYPFKSLGAPPLGSGDDGVRDNPVSSATGLPAIVVPAGADDDGLPIALELLGRPFGERALIRLAHRYEQIGHERRAPRDHAAPRG